jgi:hypothetical protein
MLCEQGDFRIIIWCGHDLLKAHHTAENDDVAIDEVRILPANPAVEPDCGADILHHGRKGLASPGDADRSRGASAATPAGWSGPSPG